ncbi:MAG: hypothetical protein IJD97_00590 [Clostridia bacterium]|nr:hypothetical protein [Clostridia bacterium]
MKNTMKRLMAVLLAGIMLFAFIGCSPAKKAENAVASLLDGLKAMDFEKVAEYVTGGVNEDSLFDSETELFVGSLLENMEYEITGSEVVDENTVNVSVSITNIDMKPVLGEFFVAALQYAFSTMNAEPAPTEEETNAKMAEILAECINKEDLAMITIEDTVSVVNVEGEWSVEMDGEFTNAILGGLEDAASELQNSMGN